MRPGVRGSCGAWAGASTRPSSLSPRGSKRRSRTGLAACLAPSPAPTGGSCSPWGRPSRRSLSPSSSSTALLSASKHHSGLSVPSVRATRKIRGKTGVSTATGRTCFGSSSTAAWPASLWRSHSSWWHLAGSTSSPTDTTRSTSSYCSLRCRRGSSRGSSTANTAVAGSTTQHRRGGSWSSFVYSGRFGSRGSSGTRHFSKSCGC
mmetsp:Transcript_17627/g.50101  ORF Transcript_17627/g.50101 Transcript_17627/m.50101 type:complete len:205 (+) Transcript_17627:1677-2291(+)